MLKLQNKKFTRTKWWSTVSIFKCHVHHLHIIGSHNKPLQGHLSAFICLLCYISHCIIKIALCIDSSTNMIGPSTCLSYNYSYNRFFSDFIILNVHSAHVKTGVVNFYCWFVYTYLSLMSCLTIASFC